MGSIIFWAAIAITHGVNTRIWRNEPKSFWYKLSWFFVGWSTFATLHYIGVYLTV